MIKDVSGPWFLTTVAASEVVGSFLISASHLESDFVLKGSGALVFNVEENSRAEWIKPVEGRLNELAASATRDLFNRADLQEIMAESTKTGVNVKIQTMFGVGKREKRVKVINVGTYLICQIPKK